MINDSENQVVSVGEHIYIRGYVYHRSEAGNMIAEYDTYAHNEKLEHNRAQADFIKDSNNSAAYKAFWAAQDWSAFWNVALRYNLFVLDSADKIQHLIAAALRESPSKPEDCLTLARRYFILSNNGDKLVTLNERKKALALFSPIYTLQTSDDDKIFHMLPMYTAREYSVRELYWLKSDRDKWLDYLNSVRKIHQRNIFPSGSSTIQDLDNIIQSRCRYDRQGQWRAWWNRLYQLTERDHRVESSLRKVFDLLGFYMRSYPVVRVSKDLPYSFKDAEERRDRFDFLGEYFPRRRLVVLYDRMIKHCSDYLNVDFDAMIAVVLAHEIGHWIAHQLPCGLSEGWPTGLYCKSDQAVLEGHAQLFCFWAIKHDSVLVDAFNKLLVGQSPEYSVFMDYIRDSEQTVAVQLLKMRRLRRPARLTDWSH